MKRPIVAKYRVEGREGGLHVIRGRADWGGIRDLCKRIEENLRTQLRIKEEEHRGVTQGFGGGPDKRVPCVEPSPRGWGAKERRDLTHLLRMPCTPLEGTQDER